MGHQSAVKRAFAFALAALLALGCCGGSGFVAGLGGRAFADGGSEEGDGTFSVQLTIIDTSADPDNVVKNEKFDGMTAQSTVDDLLAQAGYSAAPDSDPQNSAGDAALYTSSYGSPEFLGKHYDGATGAYWITSFNGDSSTDYAKAQLGSALEDGGHYQYVYASSSLANDGEVTFEGWTATFSYTEVIPDLLVAQEPESEEDEQESGTDEGAEGGDEESEPEATAAVSHADKDKASTLIANLEARFAAGGADAAISNDTVNAAIAMNSLGRGGALDAKGILSKLAESQQDEYFSAGTMAKYVMALSAAGQDATAVSDGDAVRNLVDEMEKLETGSENAYSTVYLLPAYDYGGYAAGDAAKLTKAQLVQATLDGQDASGLFGAYGYTDVQTTAQAIQALLPYRTEAGAAARGIAASDAAALAASVQSAIDAAVAGVKAAQNADGGFPGYSGSSSVDTTGQVIAALTALGLDCDGDDMASSDGVTPMAYLVGAADSDLAGYNQASAAGEPMTASAALLGLAAYAQGLGTDVYQLKATVEPEAAGGDSDDGDDGDRDATGAKPLAQTGDDAAPLAGLAALAVLAAASAALTRRRALAESDDADGGRA